MYRQPIPSGLPFGLEVDVATDDSALDLTLVTAVMLTVVRQSDGSTSTWQASVDPGATSTSLSAVYEIIPSDTTVLGLYRVAVWLSGLEVPSDAFELFSTPPERWRL